MCCAGLWQEQIRHNLAAQGIREGDLIDKSLFTQWASNTFASFDDQDFQAGLRDLLASAEAANEAPKVNAGLGCNAGLIQCADSNPLQLHGSIPFFLTPGGCHGMVAQAALQPLRHR